RDRAELTTRPVVESARELVVADEDVLPTVAVHVVQGGRRPYGVFHVHVENLVAIAVDAVDVPVPRTEHDVGVAVAVDVAKGGRSTEVIAEPATMTRCGQPGNDAPLPFITRNQPSWCPMMISGTWSLLMSAMVGDELRFHRLVLIVHAAVVDTAPAGSAWVST